MYVFWQARAIGLVDVDGEEEKTVGMLAADPAAHQSAASLAAPDPHDQDMLLG